MASSKSSICQSYHCTSCLPYAACSANQLMGDLPACRVTPSPPFCRSDMYYAGPFKIRLTKTRGKGTMKDYIAIFVCTSTRAMHMEVVEDHTSGAIIAACHRFTSRRGHCKDLISENGTNFAGASAELRGLFDSSSGFVQQVSFSLLQDGTT